MDIISWIKTTLSKYSSNSTHDKNAIYFVKNEDGKTGKIISDEIVYGNGGDANGVVVESPKQPIGGESVWVNPDEDPEEVEVYNRSQIDALHQSIVNSITSLSEAGYLFSGVATSETNPGTPDAKVFYIANGKGTYEKFGSLEVTEDEVVILYYDSSWHKVSTGIASQEKLSELVRKLGSEEEVALPAPIMAYISSTEGWVSYTYYECYLLPIEAGKTYKIYAKDNIHCYYALLKNGNTAGTPQYADGFTGPVRIDAGGNAVVTPTSEATYLYITHRSGADSYNTPKALVFVSDRLANIENNVNTIRAEVDAIGNSLMIEIDKTYMGTEKVGVVTGTPLVFYPWTEYKALIFPVESGKTYRVKASSLETPQCSIAVVSNATIEDHATMNLADGYAIKSLVKDEIAEYNITNAKNIIVRTLYQDSATNFAAFYEVADRLDEMDSSLEKTETSSKETFDLSFPKADFERNSVMGVIPRNEGKYYNVSSYKCMFTSVHDAEKVSIVTNVDYISYAFLKSVPKGFGYDADYATGCNVETIQPHSSVSIDVPTDANYLYLLTTNESGVYKDSEVRTIGDTARMLFNSTPMHTIYVAPSDGDEFSKRYASYVCDGVNDEVEIQAAIDRVKSVCGKVILCQGTFHIDSFKDYTIDGTTKKVALCMHTTSLSDKFGVTIEGTSSSKSSRTNIVVSESAFTGITGECSVFGGGCSVRANYVGGIGMNLTRISCSIPNGHDCVISNNQYLYWGAINSCIFSVIGYASGVAPIGNSVGLRGWAGWSDGTCIEIKDVYVSGCKVGFQLGGEHLVCTRLGSRHNEVGYTFGEYDFNYHSDMEGNTAQVHPITMINCCAEHIDYIMKFYGSGNVATKGANRCEVSFISFNVENYSLTRGLNLPTPCTEEVVGGWCGRLDYTIERGENDNSVSMPIWADGHGKNFRTTNIAQQQMGTTALRETFAPNYCQQYFDTDLGKMVYCIEPSTKTWVDATGTEV